MPKSVGAGRALELLAQFAPSAVLQQARDLAQQFEREEYFRKYVAQRVFVIALTCAVAPTTCFVTILLLLGKLLASIAPSALWIRVSLGSLALSIWIGITFVIMNRFFTWLQRKAMAERWEAGKSLKGRS